MDQDLVRRAGSYFNRRLQEAYQALGVSPLIWQRKGKDGKPLFSQEIRTKQWDLILAAEQACQAVVDGSPQKVLKEALDRWEVFAEEHLEDLELEPEPEAAAGRKKHPLEITAEEGDRIMADRRRRLQKGEKNR